MASVLLGLVDARVRLPVHFPPHFFSQVHVPALAVILSLLGSACYALSSVLQHKTAAQQPPELSLRPGLLLALLRSPLWLIGIVSDVAGFLFQFFALRYGSLALVTPLFVFGLVLSIIGAAYIQHRRPTSGEWVASVVVSLGLAMFLFAAQPGPGRPHTSPGGWVALFLVCGVVAGGAVALAQVTRHRALLLGAATGIIYGLTSAITEHTGHVLNHGAVHVLLTWAPYVLAITSIIGLLVNQSAFQAGSLSLSLPIMTVLEPLVAILIGQFLFGEHIASASGSRLGEILGLVITTVGVFALARHAVEPERVPAT
jgi:drug/metabolite transporter (DMT)-like permease